MAIKSPEVGRNPEDEAAAETNERDILPFSRFEEETIGNLTAEYAEGTKISDGSKKAINGFLTKDSEEGYRMFALAWFEDHKGDIQREKGVPVENVSDEWKINMVLSSKEKGGMGAAAEIRKGDYEEIGKQMDKITVLRADMAKDPIPPEAPFLLLNYLSQSIEVEKQRIKELQEKAKTGDIGAAIEADSIKNQLEILHLAQKELVEKTMHEDLAATAEQKIQSEPGFKSREDTVAEQLDGRKKELEVQRNEELINREYEEFKNMPEKQRRKYQSESGIRLEMPRDVFDKLYAKQHKSGTYTPYQADISYEKTNRQFFENAIKHLSKENEIEGPAFYGMLEQGFKPYENQKTKGLWILFQTEKISIPRKGGGSKEVPVKEYDEFIRRAGENYKTGFDLQARGEIEDVWDKDYDKKVKKETEARIEEFAKSPEAAEGGVEKVYEKARERIMIDYIKERAEKQPKTAEQIKVLQKELNSSDQEIHINDVFADLLFKKGELEGLEPENKNWKVVMSKYLHKKLGIHTVSAEAYNGITQEEYNRLTESETGIFYLAMKLMENHSQILEKEKKQKETRAAKVKRPKKKAA